MSSNNNIPRLRFPGFTGEWEYKILSKEATSFSGGTPKSGDPKYYGGSIPFIRSGEIHEAKTALFITEEGLKNSSAKLVKKGDLLYALYGATSGDVAISKIEGAINQAILCIRSETINICFLCNYLEKIKNLIISRYLQGGQGNLSSDIIMSLSIPFPTPVEQQKIVECLSEIDNLISAQGQKVDALKIKKRGLMQQLFPQQGETTPRLRFPGFTGEWEYKILSKEATSFSGGTPKSGDPKYYGGSIPFIRSGEIHEAKTALFITEEGLKNSSAKLVKKGDLLYALYGATSGDVAISKIEGAINQAILCIRSEKINNCFLCNYLEKIKDLITSRYLQGGQGNLSSDIIMSLSIPLPAPAEQQKIADFLSALDNQIAAESEKQVALKDLKKGLMQQLFPQPKK